MYSFNTQSFTRNTGLAGSNPTLTNPIIDYKNNVALGANLDEIETYDGESNVTTTLMQFKNDDFGLPDVVKKIYGVTVEYATGTNITSDGLLYRSTDSSGNSSASFIGTNLSSVQLESTSDDLDVKRFTFSSPLSVASLQLQLKFNQVDTHIVNRVSVEYKPIHKRVT